MRARVEYVLIKDNERYEFKKEKDACEFLGVKPSAVSSCYRYRCKCKGYEIERGVSYGYPERSHKTEENRLYWIWQDMKKRCYNPKNKDYKWYGGKGIKVCDDWKVSYTNFKEWALSNGYADNLTIDRVDSNKDYEPSNCQWITQSENSKRAIAQKKERIICDL